MNNIRKSFILVVDDNPSAQTLLTSELEALNYGVASCSDGQEALDYVYSAERPPVDLIIMDVMMPRMTGYVATSILKQDERTRSIPIIMVTSLSTLEDRLKGLEAGADEFLSKPFYHVELEARVKTLLKVKFLNDDLESATSVVVSLALALESRDPYTQGHSRHVGDLASHFAKWLGLSVQEQKSCRLAGQLHDIGKIGTPDAVLQKPKDLTPEEYQMIMNHPATGAMICSSLKLAREAIPGIRHHHEHFDGTGFPDGYKGGGIPIMARIVAIADAYDAMVYDRPYRKALPPTEAIANLEREAGRLFDPDLLAKFKKMIEEEGPFNDDKAMPYVFGTSIELKMERAKDQGFA